MSCKYTSSNVYKLYRYVLIIDEGLFYSRLRRPCCHSLVTCVTSAALTFGVLVERRWIQASRLAGVEWSVMTKDPLPSRVCNQSTGPLLGGFFNIMRSHAVQKGRESQLSTSARSAKCFSQTRPHSTLRETSLHKTRTMADSQNRVLRVGVIGAGEVAQVIHLPCLSLLSHLFTTTVICDLSKKVRCTSNFLKDMRLMKVRSRTQSTALASSTFLQLQRILKT